MREIVWLRLRNSPLLRSLYGVPFIAKPMKVLSHILLPSRFKRRLRVESGPAQGLIFELNPRWETQLWEGRHEIAVQQILAETLKPGSVFYDVGAGFGFYSLLAARLGAQVLAFEPDSKNASCLRHYARLNSLESKIEIHDAAVLARSGNTQLKVASQEKGHGNSQIVGAPGSEERTVTVACISLNEVAKANALPTLIKVDVEGSESDVFRGAEQVFERCRPDVICEIHGAANEAFVVDWLNRRGYSLRWIENEAGFPKHLVANPKK